MDPTFAPAWRSVLAWVVIFGMIVVMIVRALTAPVADDGSDPVGNILGEMQAKYLVGATDLFPTNAPTLYAQADGVLNLGTVGQRQRFVPVADRLGGPAEARRQLDRLDRELASPPRGEVTLTEQEQAVQLLLHQRYPAVLSGLDGEAAEAESDWALSELSPRSRQRFVDELGWFGELALGEQEAVAAGRRVAIVLLTAATVGGLALLAGFAGLIVVIVMVVLGRMRTTLGPSSAPHAVYAETFAIWLFLFAAFQELGSYVSPPEAPLLLVIVGFFASLIALGWPLVLGVPWRSLCSDIGWTAGRQPLLEPFVGVAAYVLSLPIVLAGILCTLVLMFVQQAFAPEGPTFAPSGGPAHPIIMFMDGPDVALKLQVLFIASVAAPIVEETMFRGVLYRHLRDATRGLRVAVSVALATIINTFVFAVIHPQGFVAVPALMSLAVGMTLVREWRGTLVPSMVIHAVSNGILMTTLWVLLSF